jgi:hypothetical protein
MPRKSSRKYQPEEGSSVPTPVVEQASEPAVTPISGASIIFYLRLVFFLVVLWFVGKTFWNYIPQRAPSQAPATVNEAVAAPTAVPENFNAVVAVLPSAGPIQLQIDGIKSKTAYSAWAPDGSNNPNVNKSIHGEKLRIQETFYNKGIGTHAPSEIVFDLGGRVERFSCLVGPDGSGGPNNLLVFKVFGDGVKLFESPAMRGGTDPALPVDLDVSSVEKLSLRVAYGGDVQSWGHGDWVNIKFTKKNNE